MRVAQINSVYNQGSTGRIVSDIHSSLKKKNFKSKVFYGRGPFNDDEDIINISNRASNFYDVLRTRLFNKHSESNIENTKFLINQLKEYSPDLIHIHNIHGYYLNYEILFKYFTEVKVPIVWLLHDQWAISGNAAYFDENKLDWNNPEPDLLKKLSKDYPKHFYQGQKNIKRVFERKKNIFNIDNLFIVTPSNWLKNVCENSFFKGKKIQVINNGIDLSRFSENIITKNLETKNILGVASTWDRRKGIDYFIKLAGDLDNSYKITLVGVNEKQKKKLPENIIAIEKTESIEELVILYNEADLFVNPTLEDNFPTVNIESQACGTPVLTFKTGGSPESIIEGETGQVVEKGNYEQLKKAIINWPQKNQEIQKKCKINSEKYSKEKMINNYLVMYTNILEEKNEN